MKKTVLITGATSGFGRHLARSFAQKGYHLVLNGKEEEKLRLEKILSGEGAEGTLLLADIRTEEGIEAIRSAFRSYKVDVFINNAAINPELLRGTPTNTMNELRNIILTNMTAAIALCLSAFEYFATRGGGRIVNISSVAGVRGSAKETIYAASKGGLRIFSDSVKDAWLKHGVWMTDVYSGAIATGMSSGRADFDTLISPDELADFLTKLCEPESFFVREIYVQKTRVSA